MLTKIFHFNFLFIFFEIERKKKKKNFFCFNMENCSDITNANV